VLKGIIFIKQIIIIIKQAIIVIETVYELLCGRASHQGISKICVPGTSNWDLSRA
jgi:hypothetical protein